MDPAEGESESTKREHNLSLQQMVLLVRCAEQELCYFTGCLLSIALETGGLMQEMVGDGCIEDN